MPYVSTDRIGRYLFTASYGGDKVAVSPIGENGLVEAEAIQVLPTGRNAHSILPDRSNKFVYAATLGANQVLQFIFDSKTGKLTANEPAAISPEAGHGPRHMAFSPDNQYLYVLNELSGYVTQYAIDSGKGTLTLVDSISSVPAEAGLVWGAPQAPVGAAPAPAAAAPKDDKPKVWVADIQITPNGKFGYSSERTTNKIAPCSPWRPKRGQARLCYQLRDRGAAAAMSSRLINRSLRGVSFSGRRQIFRQSDRRSALARCH
jgi:6-phosphogluconolactonase